MKIVTLMEDTPGKQQCYFEHGLSLYIETRKHRLLFDTGASQKTIENAVKMGIDLTKIDTVIISHGHYDHAGGLLDFCRINPQAEIYIQKQAGEDHYHGDRYIGIDKNILQLPHLHLLEGDLQIDDELFIFANIKGRRYFARTNLELSVKKNGQCFPDDFIHEQCLLINSEGKRILLSGCAHNGILNILDRYHELGYADPDIVISGFHLAKKVGYEQTEIDDIIKTAWELKNTSSRYYTGHCTGQKAFLLMKDIMKDQLNYMHSGDRII